MPHEELELQEGVQKAPKDPGNHSPERLRKRTKSSSGWKTNSAPWTEERTREPRAGEYAVYAEGIGERRREMTPCPACSHKGST